MLQKEYSSKTDQKHLQISASTRRWQIFMFDRRQSSSPRSGRSSDVSDHWNLQSFLFVRSNFQLLHSRPLLHPNKHRHQKQPQQKRSDRRPNRAPDRYLPRPLLFLQLHRLWLLHYQPKMALSQNRAYQWRNFLRQSHSPIPLKARTNWPHSRNILHSRRVSEVYRDGFFSGGYSDLKWNSGTGTITVIAGIISQKPQNWRH